MRQLIVRQLEDAIVAKLKERAGRHGVSMEEEHRRILRDALQGRRAKKRNFKDYLRLMPEFGGDEIFERRSDTGRKIQL